MENENKDQGQEGNGGQGPQQGGQQQGPQQPPQQDVPPAGGDQGGGQVPPQGQPYQPLPQIPNSTPVLVLGIISIVTCFCYGIVGLICGIIALVLSGKAFKLYKANPNAYSRASYNNLNAGRICAIIGVSLSGLYLLWVLFIVIVYGTAVMSAAPWEQM